MRESIAVPVRHCRDDAATQRWTLLAAIIASGIVVFLDGTIVNLALRAIGRSCPTTFLGVLEGQAYIVSGYLAVLAALLILAGALADYYGRRRIFVIGLTGFGVSSLLCGIAPNPRAARPRSGSLQGAAGALLVPGLAVDHHGDVRGPGPGAGVRDVGRRDVGADTLRPAVGGLLVDIVSWRVAFLINVPLVAIALWATIRHMREIARRDGDRLTSTGSARSSGRSRSAGSRSGRCAASRCNWQDTLAWVALVVGAVALVIFPFLMAPAAPARAAVAVPDPGVRGRSTSRRS